MKSYSYKNVRKLTKTGSGSYYCIIPKEFIRDLGWSERQKFVVKKIGKKIVIEDWEK
ncbi:hypothetical protein KAJ61_00305 [Candidatus Parcubacteria bacterium]|nr:hypothetical protein [Candidatus Parcubacteria bacterium]